jgi:putative ABC transport system substrate-binding protein
MRRRDFIGGVGAAAVWPGAGRAQQRAVSVIGFLGFFEYLGTDRFDTFQRGLAEVGYVVGRNLTFEHRSAESRIERVPALTADLVNRQVNLIVANGSTALALAAKAATQTIPIIFIVGSDPVEVGLVASFARPGGNVSGLTMITAEIAAKRFELLHEMVPKATTIGLLVNPDNPYTAAEESEVRRAAESLGVRAVIALARNTSDFEGAFSVLMREHVGALLTGADPLFLGPRGELIVSLAARHGLPTSHQYDESTKAGGLMSYGAAITEEYRRLGVYAGRILQGEKPADLPVMRPSKFKLAINLRTAKTLGIDVPPTLLALADEVIE